MKRRIVIASIGGIVFWGPPILINVVTRHELNGIVGSLLPSVTLLASYFIFRAKHTLWVTSFSLWVLLGIYVTGPWFMCVGFAAYGGGFYEIHRWVEVAWLGLSMVVPFFTLDLSFSHGTGLALGATTVVLSFMYIVFERRSATPGRKGTT